MHSVVQKGVIKTIFVLLPFTPLFAQTSIPADIQATIQTKQLAQSKQWQRLMHYRNGESEIDDPTFFFSIHGKTDLESELYATVEALINDKSDDENSTLCYYPSRSAWLLEQIPTLKTHIFIPQCTKLQQEIRTLDAKQATLILASAHINSPASAFGHTFLRIDSDANTPLISYAVNYAAQTTEDNGFIYAYQGLFGGYQGRYSMQSYAKKLKEYSDLEQRDVWEYPLNLTPEEIHKMLLHIFEISHFYADYFFLGENCSYNLLWLIEVAKPEVNLTDQFSVKAIPIDTVREVMNNKLVKETVYRPSKRKKMLQIAQDIQNIDQAMTFAKSDEYNLSTIATLTSTQKAKSLELATNALQIRYSNEEIDKTDYLNHFLRLLKERSKLGKIDYPPIPEPISPRQGHASTKVSIGYDSDEKLTARAKIAYHDIYDNESGYIPGAYINFFDTAITNRNNKTELKEINLIDIRSYAIQDAFFKPISWQVATGGKRIFDHELHAYLQAGGGVALGYDHLFGYVTLTPAIYYREQEKLSLAANSGLIYNPNQTFKFGVLGQEEWFKTNKTHQSIEPFITYSITKGSALNLKYSYEKWEENKESVMGLSWFWYF